MKKKNIFLIIGLFLILLIATPVLADSCTDCGKNDLYACGRCGYSCQFKDGVCVTNSKYVNRVKCGNISGMPKKVPEITSLIVTIVQICIPVVLVIVGSMDFIKALSSQKDDEMKKSQQMFIKRIIMAALIFFIFVIVKFVISIVADATTTNNIISCMECFLNNKCDVDTSKGLEDTVIKGR